jgi:hypothetical protein
LAGPFNFEAAKTKGGLPQLHLNPYSWSKVEFLELILTLKRKKKDGFFNANIKK